MIIRLQTDSAPETNNPSSAWPAVERIQRSTSAIYHLVTQPDHAHISGAIAANFSCTLEPDLTDDIVQAIALHDHGWAQFEGYAPSCRPPLTNRSGRPLSFLEASPEVFLKAWSGSIRAAADVSPAGEAIVSRHFHILAERRLRAAIDPPETMDRLQDFIVEQAIRGVVLKNDISLSEVQLDCLLKLLQFCDILSLVICSAANGALDLPDDFGIGALRLLPTPTGYELRSRPSVGTATPATETRPLTAPVRFTLPVLEFCDGQLVPLPELQLTIS
jgi:Protein of unknown function (DUF3891)